MKPLLRSAPLTPEDFAIFARPTSDLWTAFERGALTALYLRQDRRDADLMLQSQIRRGLRQWDFEIDIRGLPSGYRPSGFRWTL